MTAHDIERRKHPRFESSFPISFQLYRGQTLSGVTRPIEAIGTRTQGRIGNVSLEGLYVEANPSKEEIGEIVRMNETQSVFFLEIETELMGEQVTMLGQVAWYDIAFAREGRYHFRAGVFIGELHGATRELWHGVIDTFG